MANLRSRIYQISLLNKLNFANLDKIMLSGLNFLTVRLKSFGSEVYHFRLMGIEFNEHKVISHSHCHMHG